MAEAVARSNTSVLAFLWQEVELAAMPQTADERLATALAPLRTRLDMLIEMVARLSYHHVALPPTISVALSPTRIIWHSRQQWSRGDWLRLELYFHPLFREPVSLLVQVTDCAEDEREACWRVEASLIEMPESTRDEMTRLAFLTHRRQQAWRRPRNWAAGER